MISIRMPLAFALALGTLPICDGAEASITKPTRPGSSSKLNRAKPLTSTRGWGFYKGHRGHDWKGSWHGHKGDEDCRRNRFSHHKGGGHGHGHGDHCPVSPG